MLGDGVLRMAIFFSCFYKLRGGLIAIDEIENRLHYKAQEHICQMISENSYKHDTDFFIATHSYEILETLKTFLDQEQHREYRDLFRIHSLFEGREEGKLEINTWEYKNFSDAIKDKFELR